MLALFGGEALNKKRFEWNSSLDEEENRAVLEVLNSKVLSDFYGSPGERFLGGKKVKEFDKAWADYFGVAHAVSVNSATSGLSAAMGAIGIGPGDEVIVPPLTMSATAMAVMGYQALPVFADVEESFFCLDPQAVKKKITPRTKAIFAVDLLGQPAALRELREIADQHKIYLVEDNAQAPGAMYAGKPAGTWGHIGVFSLNCHKAVQTGEGGVCVTQDAELALRMQLIRNHAEAVVEGMAYTSLTNMIGGNFRPTEIQAAIGLCQLKKLKNVNEKKQELAAYFDKKLKAFEFLKTPLTRPEATHVYYLYMLRFNAQSLGISRDTFVKAINAEGYNASFGYVKPLYLLPIFQKKEAYKGGYPFCLNPSVDYSPGQCPVAERLHFDEMFYPNMIRYQITEDDINTFARVVDKVAKAAPQLRERFPNP